MVKQSINLPKTSTEKLFQNLGLLSEVSVLIPEEEISYQDPYAIDAKLDFLCGLRLLPTPLVQECPNATKKWLRAAIDSVTVADDTNVCTTGINSFDDPENLIQSVNFGCILMNDFEVPSPGVTRFLTNNPDDLNVSRDTIAIEQSQCIVELNNENISQTFKPSETKGSLLNQTNTTKQTQNGLLSKKKTATFSFKSPISVVTCHIDFEDLSELVQKEIFEMEINQTTFAYASINKTQGYLSDMLKKCCKLKEDQSAMSSVLVRNLIKMKQFLSIPQNERLDAYKKALENLKKCKESSVHLRNIQTRTNLSRETKDSLVQFYRQYNGNLSLSHFDYLAKTYRLTEKTIKVFFKNMKLRKKL